MGIDSARYLTAEVAGDVFLLDEQTGATFRLGGSGARLWQMFAAGASVEQAARAVADETRAEPARVIADAHRFVNRLSDLGVELDLG